LTNGQSVEEIIAINDATQILQLLRDPQNEEFVDRMTDRNRQRLDQLPVLPAEAFRTVREAQRLQANAQGRRLADWVRAR
jgi:hypothetical protein